MTSQNLNYASSNCLRPLYWLFQERKSMRDKLDKLFYDVSLWVSIWNNTFRKNPINCAIIYPFRVISKLGWYWNKLKNANEMNVCNNESIWSITWNFSKYYWLAKRAKQILKQHLQRYTYIGCKLCTHQCECMGTKNSSFTEEQVSRNLRIVYFCIRYSI